MAASSPIAAFLCGTLRSPIFRPARGTIVTGRFDHFTRCAASLNSNSTFDRCPSSSELRKPFALATILEATLKELWAGASPQHRTAARKLLLLDPRRVVFTMGDLLNKGTAMLARWDDCAWATDASNFFCEIDTNERAISIALAARDQTYT